MKDWAAAVKAALETIPSVDKVDVQIPRTSSGHHTGDLLERWGLNKLVDDSPQKFGIFEPHPSDGSIRFEVTIPEAVRQRVFPHGTCHSSKFRVHIDYRHGFPMTLVVGNDAKDRSVAVVPVVREFLRDEFTQRADHLGGVEFTYLPPAPMWLDGVVVRNADPSDHAPRLRVVPSMGYDQVEITVPHSATDDQVAEQIESLFEEVSLAYSLHATANYYFEVERVLDIYARDTVANFRRSGVRAFFHRLFRGYRNASDLQVMAVEASVDRRLAVERTRSTIEEMQRLRGPLTLIDWIDKEVSTFSATSAPDVERMSSYISAGTSHSVQTVAVVASAVLGGAVGSAITALLT